MVSKNNVFVSIRNKLVSNLSNTEVGATYNKGLESNKRQVVIDSPNSEENEPVFDSRFNGEEIVNVIVYVYGITTLEMDRLTDDVKDLLREDDLPDLSLIGITDINNVQVINNNKYYGKNITFTYLAETSGGNSGEVSS